jgi:hypothetical protein
MGDEPLDVGSRVRSEHRDPIGRKPTGRAPRRARVAVLLAAVILALGTAQIVLDPFGGAPSSRRATPSPLPGRHLTPTTAPRVGVAPTAPTPTTVTAAPPTTSDGVQGAPGPTGTPPAGTPPAGPTGGPGLRFEPIPGVDPFPGLDGAATWTTAASSSGAQLITVVVPCMFPETQGCPEKDVVAQVVPPLVPTGPPSYAFVIFGLAASAPGPLRRRPTRGAAAR